jgi:translation initiation factor 3 subunit B
MCCVFSCVPRNPLVANLFYFSYTDLKERFEVRLEEGLDSFIVLDGLPKVPDESKDKLIKFVLKRLNSVGKVRIDKSKDEKARGEAVFMPLAENGHTQGYVI